MPTDVEKRTLSPRDLLRVEQDELKTQKDRADENEAREQIHLERQADSLGIENTTNGKRRRISPKSNASIVQNEKEEQQQESLRHFFLRGVKIDEIGYAVSTFVNTVSSVFGASARQSHTVLAKDGSQIVFEEDVAVTLATQQTIERDQAILQTKIDEFMAVSAKAGNGYSPARVRLAIEIFNLSDEFDMRRNPKTKEYVPSMARIAELEAVHNPLGKAECKGLVCTFRIQASSVDSMGIKRVVGDVLDQNPAEIIASGAHLKGPNAPAPV